MASLSKGSPLLANNKPLGQVPDVLHLDREEGDTPGSSMTDADRMMDEVYGHHIHQNPGMHLNGGIANDARWQERW
jgi:hypothetical protein